MRDDDNVPRFVDVCDATGRMVYSGPTLNAVMAKRRQEANQPAPRWFDDMMAWFWDRGVYTIDGAAAALNKRRETLWHWRKRRKPSAQSIAKIIQVTKGDIDPRKRRR